MFLDSNYSLPFYKVIHEVLTKLFKTQNWSINKKRENTMKVVFFPNHLKFNHTFLPFFWDFLSNHLYLTVYPNLNKLKELSLLLMKRANNSNKKIKKKNLKITYKFSSS